MHPQVDRIDDSDEKSHGAGAEKSSEKRSVESVIVQAGK